MAETDDNVTLIALRFSAALKAHDVPLKEVGLAIA